ncbi:multidrug effflux MFS transporter [Pararhizobium mangrovi]|nr:multidrug effflux MFS transporter [Pararhizobium mangrovi]
MSANPAVAGERPGGVGKTSRAEFICLLAALMAVNSIAIDIMLPAFPNMADFYSLSDPNNVQFVLIAYIVGFGGAQIAFGPISDRFGRRSPLFAGLGLYIVCALIGAFAPTFGILLFARFFQGLGAAATRIIALSIIRDTHSGRQMASIMSFVMMVFMIVPVIAPATGQVLILIGHWQLIFAFMAIMSSLITVWTVARLPETLPESHRRPLTLISIVQAFRIVLTNRLAFCYAMAIAFYFGSLFAYVSSAQQIYVGVYDLGVWFPAFFSGVAILMAVSNFVNAKLVGRLGQRRLSHGALVVYVVLSITLMIAALLGPVPFWLFYLILGIMMPLFGWVVANFNSIAMEPLGAVAGTASAVLGFTQTAGGGIIGAVIGQTFDGTMLPLATGFAIVSTIALLLVLVAENGKLFGAEV